MLLYNNYNPKRRIIKIFFIIKTIFVSGVLNLENNITFINIFY